MRHSLARLVVLLIAISLAAVTAASPFHARDVGERRNGTTLLSDQRQAEAQLTAGRPNIIVFYVDDVPPHDGRLWSDPTLTPTLFDTFVDGGVEFTNAVGETSLCCPARASLMTGQHTHNHGVLTNDARLFDPREHIGRAMKEVGYASMWVGKYMNLNHLLTEAQWTAHGSGWSQLDAIVSRGSGFYDYQLHTKQGTVQYGRHHSTRMAAERTVAHIRSTPATTPVFAVMSLFNMHGPNHPMPEFATDPRCAAMAPWSPPNYNEADVSDKPALIRSLPLQPYPDGWPMVTYCREALGVDWAAARVIDALRAENRLENTVLVFTADNGAGWGAHRIGQQKSLPYTTPVPLYISWPARWDNAPRSIGEVVSNIDLAPTFCALAGCALDGYPGGQVRPDGVNLLALLDETAATLGRTAVLESNWEPGRSWTAVRTSPSHPIGPWHYVEHATGEHELYDLSNDPWELRNSAGVGALAGTQRTLAQALAQLRTEAARPRVDATLAVAGGTPRGAHIYSASASYLQTVKQRNVAVGSSPQFVVRIWNRGGKPDFMGVLATNSGDAGITVRYLVQGVDVSSSIEAGTYRTPILPIQGSSVLTIQMNVAANAPPDARRRAVVRVWSASQPARVDVVKAVSIR